MVSLSQKTDRSVFFATVLSKSLRLSAHTWNGIFRAEEGTEREERWGCRGLATSQKLAYATSSDR
jgi:hypothetical protein